MKEQYSINDILDAVGDLENLKKTKFDKILLNKPVLEKKLDIPLNTLNLIEEAENTKKNNTAS